MKSLNFDRLSKNIDEIAQYDLVNHKVFGSAYLVYQNGLTLEKCYGTLSLDTDKTVKNTSVFRLASMTKPITAVAALILVERGLLSLDDRVDQFLPEFKDIKIQDAAGNTAVPKNLPTIRHILSHTSGIGSMNEKIARMGAEDRITIDASVAFHIRNGLDFEPGTAQMYSGSGAFAVLTKIIEMVSGRDYLTFLKEEILQPCNMQDTTFTPNGEQQERMAAMHNRQNSENVVFEMPAGCIFETYPCTHYLGGAGLVSTLHDYGNFCKMLLSNGAINGTQILKEETLKLLSTPQVPKEIMKNPDQCWGLGVRVITENSAWCLPAGSFGWSGAYGGHFWIDPENQIFAVFMKNSKIDGGASNESATNFEKAVYSSL